jgi:hypothetical protein
MKQVSILLCCLIALALMTSSALAQNCDIEVNPTKGSADCNSNGTACQTISQAVIYGFAQANKCRGVVISLAPGTYSGPGNVGLLFSTQPNSISYNPGGYVQMLTITRNMEDGAGKVIIDGQKSSQIFSFVDINFEVQVRGIDFVGGAAIGDTSQNGGCISYTQKVQQSLPFYILFSTFNKCDSNGNGGAIYIQTIAFVHLRENEFVSNVAGGNGGALYLDSQTNYYTFVEDSYFTSNKAVGNGGGVYFTTSTAQSGKATISNCAFVLNSASFGGGLYTDTVSGSFLEFSQNSAKTAGGGMAIAASTVDPSRFINITQFMVTKGTAPKGAGVYILNANLLLNKGTISANNATDSGGGVYMLTDDPKYQTNKIQISNSNVQVNTAQKAGGGIYCSGAVSPWSSVFLQSNSVTDGSDDQDVTCDSFCVSQYCTTCACKQSAVHCGDCPSGSCSFDDDNQCACYVTPKQFEEDCAFPQTSPSASPGHHGLSHGGKVWLGLTFGLFLPLILVAIVAFVYLRNRRNRYSGYSTLGENERLVSNW